MPIYEYRHRKAKGETCEDVFEVFQKMSDAALSKCPVCGKPATRKISGGAGLVFKGSGFYITDYGKDGKGPRKAETTESTKEAKDSKTGSAKDTGAKDIRETKAPKETKPDKPAKKADE